ncbi:sensor histidine kinase [Streptosporangium sp. G11]|uniref:sensor histidine kinase n=1 Tax=Streptosporangium sp. G11 TaxID=3436926 RepID=UPI003EBFFAB6
MKRFIVATAILRAVLIGRLVSATVATVVTIRLSADVTAAGLTLALIVVVTIVALALISRHPALLRHRVAVVAVDAAATAAVLLTDQGGVAYFCFAAGSAALAGVLLGTVGAMLWIAHTVIGLSVAVQLLRDLPLVAREQVAPFLVAAPMLALVYGVGAAMLTAALYRYMQASIAMAVAAQRSAAASERARLARELHDSVAKTLRGVSFAAVALPSSLRRQPALAEQLAATVSRGADAAVREARELLTALRRDVPDQPFCRTVHGVGDDWSRSTGIAVRLTTAPVEPSLAARYELAQILHEALVNVERHAEASAVEVTLDQVGGPVRLTVRDDGAGFDLPADLSHLSAQGRFGVVGMAERAETVGGTLQVRSRPGSGTVITADVPAAAERMFAA